MSTSIIQQGFNLMIYGMGIVFLFLTLLIFTTTWVSKIIQKWFPEQEKPVIEKKQRKNLLGSGSVDPVTLKVIQAAITQHRQRVR